MGEGERDNFGAPGVAKGTNSLICREAREWTCYSSVCVHSRKQDDMEDMDQMGSGMRRRSESSMLETTTMMHRDRVRSGLTDETRDITRSLRLTRRPHPWS